MAHFAVFPNSSSQSKCFNVGLGVLIGTVCMSKAHSILDWTSGTRIKLIVVKSHSFNFYIVSVLLIGKM